MKVGYLINRYPSVSHTFIRREIAALEAQGVEVERFTIRPEGDLVDPADQAEQARTHVLLDGLAGLAAAAARRSLRHPLSALRAGALAVRIGVGSDRGVLRHLVYWAEACRLSEQLERLGCAHLHAHFATNPAAVALLARTLGGPPYSFTVHGQKGLDLPGPRSLLEKARRAAFLVGVSEFHRRELGRRIRGEDAARIHVVPCGLDEEFLSVTPTPVPADPRLVCVGRLSPEKEHGDLLAAAELLATEGRRFTLTLVGDGPLRERLEAEVARRGLGEHVQLLGRQPGARVREELLAARALVLQSSIEGLPVVIMEALACARPVVATAIAGIPELVTPGTSGWLVPPREPEQLAAALREVLDADPETLSAMGRAGREQVLARHDVYRSAALLRDLFARSTGA